MTIFGIGASQRGACWWWLSVRILQTVGKIRKTADRNRGCPCTDSPYKGNDPATTFRFAGLVTIPPGRVDRQHLRPEESLPPPSCVVGSVPRLLFGQPERDVSEALLQKITELLEVGKLSGLQRLISLLVIATVNDPRSSRIGSPHFSVGFFSAGQSCSTQNCSPINTK